MAKPAAKKPGSRAKARTPAKPNQANGGAHATAPAAPPAPSPAPPQHNGPPTEAQIRAHRLDRLAALTAQHRDIDNKMTVQKAKVDEKVKLVDAERESLRELNSQRAAIRATIQRLAPGGYPMDIFDRSYADLRQKTPQTDIEQRLKYEAEIYEVHGHPTFAQLQLNLEKPLPRGADELALWRARGYQDGILGNPCDAKEAGCPGGPAMQEYTHGWGDGQAVIARGMASLKEDHPKAPPPGEVEGAPDWDGESWPQDNLTWSAEQKERFADWYETVPVDETPIIMHAGAAAEFKRLAALEEAAQGFEAPAEELQQQIGRSAGPGGAAATEGGAVH